MHKTKKRNAITRINQVLQNKRQRQQPPIQHPPIQQPPIQQPIAAAKQPKRWTKTQIKEGLQLLQNPKNMAQNKFDLIENQIAEYERNKVSSRKSSQFFGDVLTRLKEEYQTNADLNKLISSVPITEDQYEEVRQRCHRD